MARKVAAVDAFLAEWKANSFPIGDLTREHQFHPERRWRFDIAWPSLKIAVEIDGQGYGHQSIKGRISDCEKQNAALVMGWKVFRFSTAQINTDAKLIDSVAVVAEFMCGAREA